MTGGLFTNPLSPLAPYQAAIKVGGKILGALILLGMVLTIYIQHGKIVERGNLLDTIAGVATEATVKPDAKGVKKRLPWKDVPLAITTLNTSFLNAMGTLQNISDKTVSAKQASDAADKALNKTIDAMEAEHVQKDADAWDPWAK